MSSVPKKVVILMNTALYLEIFQVNKDYSQLFDSLMDKFEQQKVLLDYIYEAVKENMFEQKAIAFQKQEYVRLINLTSISEEFNNDFQKELRCLGY